MVKYKLEKAKKEEMPEITQFINECFHIDFKKSVGKLYKDETKNSDYHYVIKQNNKIIAAICINESEWIFANQTLKIAGIGSVCVSPDYRKRGIMQYMMKESNKIIREKKADIAVLTGKYERYNHFHYECNDLLDFEVTYNKKKEKQKPQMQFIEMKQLSAEDIIECNKLHERKMPFIKRRIDTFVESCYQWDNKAFGIKEKEKLVGYMVTDKDLNSIEEIEVTEEQIMLPILNAFMEQQQKEKIHIYVNKMNSARVKSLKEYPSKMFGNKTQMCQIINFPLVIETLLQEKKRQEELSKGKLRIKIEEYGAIEIKVEEKVSVIVSKMEDAITDYDMQLSYNDTLKLLLNHYEEIPNHIKSICDSWFPLNIYFYTADLI